MWLSATKNNTPRAAETCVRIFHPLSGFSLVWPSAYSHQTLDDLKGISLIEKTVILIWNKGNMLSPPNKSNNINKWVHSGNKSRHDTETLMT